MRKTINAGIYQIDSIRVVEHMRIHLESMAMTLVDRRAKQIRRQPRRPAVAVVDPDFDEVHLL